jgi:hypothetical protein
MSKLGNFIQRKGEAPRPSEIAQRGEPVAPAKPASKTKSLTVKLTDADYDRLREYAHRHRLTHQDVIEGAVLERLKSEGF